MVMLAKIPVLLETTANWLAGRAMHAAHLQVDQRAPQFLQPFAGPSWVKAELMTRKDLATSQRFWATYFFADFEPQEHKYRKRYTSQVHLLLVLQAHFF
jgi:hypothetical protein